MQFDGATIDALHDAAEKLASVIRPVQSLIAS
jgi:hypothetical protein